MENQPTQTNQHTHQNPTNTQMIENPQHGYLYAITDQTDQLATPPEPYLYIETPQGNHYLYTPHLTHHDGPHPIDQEHINIATTQGYKLDQTQIISLWTQRDHALINIARSQGLLPNETGPINDAETILRQTTPQGRIHNTLKHSTTWPNSTLTLHQTPQNTFKSITVTLRTQNPYQARSLLILLGADQQDTNTITGIQPPHSSD